MLFVVNLHLRSETNPRQHWMLCVGVITITWPKTFIRAMVFHSVRARERWQWWTGRDQYKGSTNIPRLLRDTSHTIPRTIPFQAWHYVCTCGRPAERRSNNKQLSLLIFRASITHKTVSDQWYRTKESIRDCCNDGDEGLTFHSSFEPSVQKIFGGRIKV